MRLCVKHLNNQRKKKKRNKKKEVTGKIATKEEEALEEKYGHIKKTKNKKLKQQAFNILKQNLINENRKSPS
jgi:hypothetical protein